VTVLYELAVLGAPTDAQVEELEAILGAAVATFGLTLGQQVAWAVKPAEFKPAQQRASAAAFYGGDAAPTQPLDWLLRTGVPIIPVVSDIRRVAREIPVNLRRLNCMSYGAEGARGVATLMLECAGLLPRQRRVFLSYRRCEARQAALQLFDALSARLFDVFLDTHEIAPAEDFQAMLWHRLCDSDVLIMLDTAGYFESRWTSAEFGRALAKSIAVLRVGWPDTTPSIRTQTTSRVELVADEIDAATGRLENDAVLRICVQTEAVRSQSHAVRAVNLVSNLRNAVERIQGRVVGVGPGRSVHIELADGRPLVVYPTLGVPTSHTLHEAADGAQGQSVAVVYDHIGLHPRWLEHIDWLGRQIRAARWLRVSEAAWQLAAWEA
jgi:hypothetical protein